MPLLLSPALTLPAPPQAPLADPALAARMKAFVEAFHRIGAFSGTVLVARRGRVVFEGSVGEANLEWSIPNTPDTVFRIGSLTKPITAALVLRLVDLGKLRLDGTLASQLAGYRADTGAKVTLRQLLAHTSGIPSFTQDPDYPAFAPQAHRVPDFVKARCSGDLEFEPGTRWAYSNSAYYLLGALIERATGLSYGEALRQYVFDPLGMAHSRFEPGPALVRRRAYGYVRTLGGWVEAPHLDGSVLFSTGGLHSTTRDLLAFEQGLGGTFLKAATRDQVWKAQTPAGPGPTYGLGWFLHALPLAGRPEPLTLQSHGGEVDGFNAQLVRAPEEGLTVILLHNEGPTRLPELSSGLIRIALGQAPPPPRPTALDALLPVLREQGLEAAVARGRALATHPDAPCLPFREEEAGAFGMYMMRLGRPAEAASVFGLTAALLPDSPRAQASLGRALEAAGRPAEALAAFEEALRLDPRDPFAKAGVARLRP